ncbi:MAG: 2,3-diphosphoglycerate-dependent phosphoglycerate mutase [Patescibacteria group bacterium]
MRKLVLIRHGESIYNKEKIFCGWTDVELTENGIEEAHHAGQLLKKEGYSFDIAFASVLKRAIDTLSIILEEMNEENIPIEYSWRLNERHYGALQGLKHEQMANEYGAEQVRLWRRSYKVKPPLLKLDDSRYPGNDVKYKDLDKNALPRGESLEDTVKRVLPYWDGEIAPKILEGKSVIVSASGNSLRALIKHIDGMDDDEIVRLEIKMGVPLVYELEDDGLKPIRHYYLG